MACVYVFGAGASRDAGYPLASEMGSALFKYMLKSEDALFRKSAKFLLDTFGESSNIEDLISEIQSRIKKLENPRTADERDQRTGIGISSDRLSRALIKWFREIRKHPAPNYAIFADRIVQPRDVIITFNYDDSLERELKRSGKWDISRGYGIPLGDNDAASETLVLKLHGSVNWMISLFAGTPGGTLLVNPASSMGNLPIIHRTDLEFLGYETFSGRSYQNGGVLPCLILPGRNKEFFYDTTFGHEFEDFWDHLWSRAIEALRAADKVVICGYSLPGADQRARDLLFRRPRRETEIEIVSGNQSARIAGEFRRAGFSRVSAFSGEYFAAWCRANQSTQ